MRILIAEDHAILRSGLCRIIKDDFPDAEIGEAGCCKELLDHIKQANWTVLILDIALGNQNSLNLVPALLQIQPDLRIVVLSMYGERQFVIHALRVGASAYLTKERAPEELLQAIRSVCQGKRYLDNAVALKVAEHVAFAGSKDAHESLSAREYEVFLLLTSGCSVSEIAIQLVLSVKTISTYRSRILEKMGMSSNAELMRYALRQGLVK